MKIGVTAKFLNSYFSGALPQVAIALSKALSLAGHSVVLLKQQQSDPDWFIDLNEFKSKCVDRIVWSNTQHYDVVIEATWHLSSEDRKKCADRVYSLAHFTPIFHDMESCVYQWNPIQRDWTNVTAILTYDHYSAQDVRYLEFLSNKPVIQIPYVWDPDALDIAVKESGVPTWAESAKRLETTIPKDAPSTMSWCSRVVESNFSNTSHCVVPLNIISEIRTRADPIRFCVHNGDHTAKNEFFKSNVVKNLLLPDISGSMVPRVRIVDLRRDKTVLICHQRFRPLKTYLLDALYLGIPMIHNCASVKSLGAPYYYELNQIQNAVEAWRGLKSDYEAGRGFFSPKAGEVRQTALRARYSPAALFKKFNALFDAKLPVIKSVKPVLPNNEVRIAFCNMWDDFQPEHNFFTYLLCWAGQQNGITVSIDSVNPNVVFFGPLSNGAEKKYPGVKKVYFTGENAPPNKDSDIFLNLGFMYETNSSYIRLPLWVLEINWFGANPDRIVNPRPVELKDAMTVDPKLLTARPKFCAFVATNPNNQNRNAAFQILDKWRGVDSGGRLYCNLRDGPIPAGRGGGGGELAKIEFYKNYRFAITFENSSSPGYTTEKLFHAKVAGAVPIYWGDPFVDRDFDTRGFINANQVTSAEELVQLVNKVESDPEAWKAMASVPALSEFKKRWCEKTMEMVASAIFKAIVNKSDLKLDWSTAINFGSGALVAAQAPAPAPAQAPTLRIQEEIRRVFVTATNMKFAESAANVIASMAKFEPSIQKVVYVWPDVPQHVCDVFMRVGATEIRKLPTDVSTETPWPDFWDPQHYAWKLWVQQNMIKEAPDNASVLYLDAGVVLAAPIDRIWSQIETCGIFLLNDDQQINERWCHPTCVSNMNITTAELAGNQITAGLLGYKVGHAYTKIANDALMIAKTQRDTIVGDKWKAYTKSCMGHRHDQSILSVLTQRAGAPRLPLREFYTDISMRHAQYNRLPLYVHRGNFKEYVPFVDGIDEAYVINLERRGDRYERFCDAHKNIKERVYRWKATDGLALQLTPELKHLFRNNDFKWKKSVMGCAISHMGLWEKLAKDPLAKSYLILEDDVKFEDRWLLKWINAAQHIPADTDVIYLGGVLPPNKPALPHITEPVNAQFARVAKNTMFGGHPRRYFHFCNYSYILTKRGAEKLMKLIADRGIFTSGDHMIVNHGDDLLNIYFTTPLLATCFQENDPAYQKSEFNNFSRVDNFDSDLWNNTECFNAAEVGGSAAPASLARKLSTHEERVAVWNTFLRRIALKDVTAIKQSIDDIFSIWEGISNEEFAKNLSWFRIFEQLMLTKNDVLLPHVQYILQKIENFSNKTLNVWAKIKNTYESSKPANSDVSMLVGMPRKTKTTKVWHLGEINPGAILETEWLDSLLPAPIEWAELETLGQLANSEKPLFLVMHIPGQNMEKYKVVFDILAEHGKQTSVLHLSDEYANDDISWYKSPSVTHVYRNYWRHDLGNYKDKVTLLPLGFARTHSGTHLPQPPQFSERNLIWSFAGSADRQGRVDSLKKLESAVPFDLRLKDNWASPAKAAGDEYNKLLRNSKFVPCPRGSTALESYRLYEALEHGAIPVYIASESHNCRDEYAELFGKHPLLGFPSWEKAGELLPKLAQQPAVMEKHVQQLQVWWSEQKAALKAKLASL